MPKPRSSSDDCLPWSLTNQGGPLRHSRGISRCLRSDSGLTSPVRLLNMFDKSAHLCDLAYSFKDYASESHGFATLFTLGSPRPGASLMLRVEPASTSNTSGASSTVTASISALSL